MATIASPLPTVEALCMATLPYVPFDGWSQAAFRQGLASLELPDALGTLLCPEGMEQLVATFCLMADRRLEAETLPSALEGMRVHEKITYLAQQRILLHQPHREATRRAIGFWLRPSHYSQAIRCLWHTVDTIWHMAGDRATDFNYYSKRSLLAYVYLTTLLIWLDDTSEDYAYSWHFLKRRIEEVLVFGKTLHHLKSLPDQAMTSLKHIPFLRLLLRTKY